MTEKMSIGPRHIAMLFALAMIWSSSFLAIKFMLETVPPVTGAATRLCLGAGLAVAICLVARTNPIGHPRDWPYYAGLALFGNAIPFTLINWGEVVIDSGMAAILMSVMPLSTFILAHLLYREERLTPRRIAGMALGFAGVLTLVGPGALAGIGEDAARQLAVAGGGFCYAIATMIARRMPALPVTTKTSATLVFAATAITPVAFLIEDPSQVAPSAGSWAAIVYLATLPTVAAVFLYFRLVERTGVALIAMNNYLIPVLGVMWGALILAERPEPTALVALALILAGTIAAGRGLGLRRTSPAPQAAPPD